MNSKSCLNCSSYFFCRKEEKVVGNGCLDFKQTGNIDFLNLKEKSEVIKKPKLISPPKEEEQELVKEDYSEYFLGGGIDKLQLPEEDFPLAKNIYEFVFSKKFLGYILYPKQLEIAIGYFQEYCPDCSDINYVKNIPTNADIDEIFFYITLLEHEICPKCFKTKYDFIKEGKLTDYINLIGLAGQRVGKSAMTGIFSIYTLHRFLKMDDIFKTFNLLSSSPLQGTFVALNKAQVKYSAWPHIQSLTRNSPWFSGYNEMLQYYGRKVGYKLFDVSKEESVDYFYKNIRYSVATPDKGALRGRSSICVVGSTKIHTNKGILPIKQLFNYKDYNYKIISNNQPSSIIDWKYNGRRKVYTLVTDYGYNITLTDNHKIKILSKDLNIEWKTIKELDVKNDRIALQGYQEPVLINPKINYEPCHNKLLLKQRLVKLFNNNLFTINQLIKATGWHYNSISKIISRLRKLNLLKRKKETRNGVYYYKWVDIKQNPAELFLSKTFRAKAEILFPLEMNEDLGYLLGYLVSEGNYYYDNEFCIPQIRECVVLHISDLLKRQFNYTAPINIYFDNSGNKVWNIRISYKEIRNFLRYIGLEKYSHSTNKKIPNVIFKSDKKVQAAFLSALFEGDGSCDKNTFRVNYTSFSSNLLQQLQYLFLTFGIFVKLPNKRSVKKKINRLSRGKKKMLNYETVGRSANNTINLDSYASKKFFEQIGFVFKYKNAKFKFQKISNMKFYKIPNSQMNVNLVPNRKSSVMCDVELNAADHDYRALKYWKKRDLNKYNKLAALIDSNLVWAKINNIYKNGNQKVYDITIDNPDHSFSGNGVVLHNCSAVDEIGWFNSEDSSKVKTSADEIYASISRSFLTVSGAFRKLRAQGVLNIPNPTFYVVSSPSHARDKICQLYENSKLNNQEYGFKYATWDIHPDFPRDCQDIQNDYNKDPLKADRDWGANPPLSSNPFIENPSLVGASFNSTRTNLLNIKYSIEANVATGYSYEITKSSIDTTKARVLTLDLSYNDNSTALSIGYFDKVEGRIIVESMNEIIPTMQTKINLIDFLEKIIKPLIPQLNIQIICGDRWNTLPIFQELEKKFKIKAFAYTPSYGDFQFFKQNLINNKIDFPSIEDKEKVYTQDLTNYPLVFYNKPVSHFFFQCITVVDDKKHEDDKKNSVKKGEKTTDDIFRTVVLLHYVLNNYQYKEWLDRKQINKIELSSFGSYDSSSGQKPGTSSPRLSNKYGSVI